MEGASRSQRVWRLHTSLPHGRVLSRKAQPLSLARHGRNRCSMSTQDTRRQRALRVKPTLAIYAHNRRRRSVTSGCMKDHRGPRGGTRVRRGTCHVTVSPALRSKAIPDIVRGDGGKTIGHSNKLVAAAQLYSILVGINEFCSRTFARRWKRQWFRTVWAGSTPQCSGHACSGACCVEHRRPTDDCLLGLRVFCFRGRRVPVYLFPALVGYAP